MKRKTIAILLAVAMVASLCMTGSAMAKAKKPSYKLLKSAKISKYDKEKKKWVTRNNYSFKYNKKNDPVKIIKKYDDSDETIVNSFKYKKGKKKSMTTKTVLSYTASDGKVSKETINGPTTIKYNKKGNRISAKNSTKNIGHTYNGITTYKYKKGYIVLRKYNGVYKYNDGQVEKHGTQYKNTIKFRKNGIPSSVITREKDQNDKKWSYPIFKATFNKKGLYKKYIYDLYNTVTYTFKYKYNKQGLVTRVDITSKDEMFNTVSKTRITFKYTKKKTDLKRYGNMINEYTEGSNHSFWY